MRSDSVLFLASMTIYGVSMTLLGWWIHRARQRRSFERAWARGYQSAREDRAAA